MKITILNGDMTLAESSFSQYVQQLAVQLSENHMVEMFRLQDMNLQYCTGCWSCWWKTPGICSRLDDAEPVFRAVINSDFVIFASPLMVGFTSSALKKITDRLIVLLHPYIEIRNGECHHRKRYEKYPDFGLILQKEISTDAEDMEIVNNIYDRFAINFHNKRKFTWYTDQTTPQEIVYETCNI